MLIHCMSGVITYHFNLESTSFWTGRWDNRHKLGQSIYYPLQCEKSLIAIKSRSWALELDCLSLKLGLYLLLAVLTCVNFVTSLSLIFLTINMGKTTVPHKVIVLNELKGKHLGLCLQCSQVRCNYFCYLVLSLQLH